MGEGARSTAFEVVAIGGGVVSAMSFSIPLALEFAVTRRSECFWKRPTISKYD